MPQPIPRRPARGFTLFEPAAAVAAIAVLLGLYLPAAQQIREATNSAAAAQVLGDVVGALERHGEAGGALPTDLDGVVAVCARDLRCRGIGDGQPTAHGHRFFWNPAEAVVEAWPEFPGLTGSSVLFQGLGDPDARSVAYPGAERLRRQAMRSLLEVIHEQIGEGLGNQGLGGLLAGGLSDPCADRHLLCGEAIRGDVFFGEGARGLLGPGVTPEQEAFIGEALVAMRDALKIGAAGEDPADWFLSGPDVSGIDPTPFLFGEGVLRDLQARWVGDREARRLLRETLRDARRAERRGDAVAEAAALDTYVAILDTGVLAWVQRRHAETMRSMAEALRDD